MDHDGEVSSQKNKQMKGQEEVMSSEEEDGDEETWDSDDDDDTIARIQRAHYAQAAAMSKRRRAPARPRAMSQKRKMEAFKNFHNFTKKLKKDTGVSIKSIVGKNILELSDFSSEEDSKSDSDGLSDEEFVVNPKAIEELDGENESYIDPETGDIVERKKSVSKPGDSKPEHSTIKSEANSSPVSQSENEPELDPLESIVDPDPEPDLEPDPEIEMESEVKEEPKTLTIGDLIDEGDLDLTKTNVEIAEVEESELCPEKTAEDLLDMKEEENSQDFDIITEKLKDMGEISVTPISKEVEDPEGQNSEENKAEGDDEKKSNTNALNVRRNIREVMDEKQLDASTLAAQRQESERLARVQEQQRIIREVQRQIAINRQNKVHQKTLQLLQGGSSILKKGVSGNKLNLPNTVLVKLPSGDVKKTTMKQGQVEVTRIPKPTTSGAVVGQKVLKPEQKTDKKEVVEIVDSSSGEESSSSSSDSDDCIMLSDSEVPPSPEAEDDPNNSGLHVNDAYNLPDEQGRVQINVGHPENEEDIFLAPQISRIIKPHQIGGVRFLFDNIIESVERFSTSTGFGCILAHSMGLGKTLQIVCFCDIFLRHTSSKTVLCIMPINTLQNWVAEFNKWLPIDPTNNPLAAQGEIRPRNFPIYVLNDSHKTLSMRAKVVKDWTTTGGVLMIGYELYRLLSMKKDKKPRKKRKAELKLEAEKEKEKEKEDKKTDKPDLGNEDTQGSDITTQSKVSDESKQEDGDQNKPDDDKKEDKREDSVNGEDKKLLDEMYEALVKPGPDLVICDEGHRIKNSHSNISYALKQMRTKRRVVLTGYPLQNNLLEYWCMVDFVRPNYLGSKTEFCNMFERPIQNGQCIDSTPQDIRLMRYRAHVLHSLLVGFVQRRSHAVLQSTLPQKEEFVMLIRMTPLQRKLYDRFMNEVVRCTSVPNPLKAFAICCKIWNHPDVLYNFLRKRSEVNAAIEDDLDLEEIGGVTKAGRANRGKAPPLRRGPKPKAGKGASKKPAATIPPNTSSTGPSKPHPDDPNSSYGNGAYPANGPQYGPPGSFRPNQPDGSYPPYPDYQNSGPGYYPPNQQQNYGNNYYQQPQPQPQQPPYSNNYPNQYPQNNTEQGYNQNYWGNSQGQAQGQGSYYGNSDYYNNPQFPNNQPPQDFRRNPPQYPPNYSPGPSNQPYQENMGPPPFQNNQEGYANQPPQPYPQPPFQNQPGYPGYDPNAAPGPVYPDQPAQSYPDQSYPPTYPANTPYNPTQQYNPQYNSGNYPGYPNSAPNQPPGPMPNQIIPKTEPVGDYPAIKTENDLAPSASGAPYNPAYDYNQPNTSAFPNALNPGANNYQAFPPHLETKPPLGSSGSPVPAWPLTGPLKSEVNKLKNEEKTEVKSESDGEVKIEDLDTKTIVKDETKSIRPEAPVTKDSGPKPMEMNKSKPETTKMDSASEEDMSKKSKPRGKGKEKKKTEVKRGRPKGKAKGRKDRKTSKEKNDDSDSEESEKEEKRNREEELALSKKAEEVTYDWATELLKDYIPSIIENSAKMELFFYILNESIKLGDRILLFSQSLFTLNLIEDFLVRNYIPGTHCLWEKNTSYYRLDGSTHALEREKLINEFNANPHVYLFLVSTRAGSLGINLVGANRVIVFDASWNPCHDTQAVCRVYRYGQKKPCFVYRFVMDCCLEKKIYDRQINKQGMADRVVDECNPDAVLSMKEITNLCFDNDEKESEARDLSEYKDKYIDVIMQGIITRLGRQLSREPFQHESLLVDRKEKKLSSAEKRLAQRGYELEKKAAAAPKPTTAYRTVRTADGSIVQRPVGTVRPMQHGARWIPADVWRRQGMTAQEMTLPLDVVIPTNSAEKTNIVLKAGQRVMVLKSPKGIYMQLESGKIIAIKTSLKGLTQKPGEGKDAVGKKILGARPSTAGIPGSLKNNSAITITSKSGPRPGLQRVLTRPSMLGPNKVMRPLLPGQRSDIRRIGSADLKSYAARKGPMPPGRIMRPGLPGSVSITKITRDPKKSDNDNSESHNRVDALSDDDTQVLDSDEDDKPKVSTNPETSRARDHKAKVENSSDDSDDSRDNSSNSKAKDADSGRIVLTTDEKLPSEDAFDNKSNEGRNTPVGNTKPQEESRMEHTNERIDRPNDIANDRMEQANDRMDLSNDRVELSNEKTSKINLLKNYRHQRLQARATESSLSQLEKTAISLNKEGGPAFRKNLDDITQSYSPAGEERPAAKSRKKKSPNKTDTKDAASDRPALMSHSVSSMLGPGSNEGPRIREEPLLNTLPVAPMGQPSSSLPMSHSQEHLGHSSASSSMHGTPPMSMSPGMSPGPELHKNLMPAAPLPMAPGMSPGQYPGAPAEIPYGQYPPGYGMAYAGYPAAPYYGGYGAPPYYPGYAAPGPPYPAPHPAPAPDAYPPPNPQW